MNRELGAPLRFVPGYMERVWGGDRLRANAPEATLPPGPIGEAWLIADHPNHESVVVDGPWAGATLHEVLVAEPEALLGRLPKMATGQRFPLLLKLLDAAEVLSVQVHPNDEQAAQLGETDGGKTEMWHVLEADDGAELLCGFRDSLAPDAFESAVGDGSIGAKLLPIPARPGSSIYVKAGTVHALGAGVLVAEIQQNSDVTYRVYDWGRKAKDGSVRELHTEKAAKVADLAAKGVELPQSWRYTQDEAIVQLLSYAPFFAAEAIDVHSHYRRNLDTRSFSILLCVDGTLKLRNAQGECELDRLDAAVIPACGGSWDITGRGRLLHYYVADLAADLVEPLKRASIEEPAIRVELSRLDLL